MKHLGPSNIYFGSEEAYMVLHSWSAIRRLFAILMSQNSSSVFILFLSMKGVHSIFLSSHVIEVRREKALRL